jgi:hypothetical protein
MGDLKTLVSLSQQLIIAEGSLNQIRYLICKPMDDHRECYNIWNWLGFMVMLDF